MENISIEKSIKFEQIIDKIETIKINDELKCEIIDENTHAIGALNISGSIITPLGVNNFSEDVEIDIYAPFDKKIDKDKFKIKVKDYSYVVNNKTLTVYVVLDMEGFKEEENEVLEANYDEIINSMNNINDINSNDLTDNNENLLRNNMEKVKIIEKNDKNDKISSSWASDLFKLNQSYCVFKVIHKDSEKHN